MTVDVTQSYEVQNQCTQMGVMDMLDTTNTLVFV